MLYSTPCDPGFDASREVAVLFGADECMLLARPCLVFTPAVVMRSDNAVDGVDGVDGVEKMRSNRLLCVVVCSVALVANTPTVSLQNGQHPSTPLF